MQQLNHKCLYGQYSPETCTKHPVEVRQTSRGVLTAACTRIQHWPGIGMHMACKPSLAMYTHYTHTCFHQEVASAQSNASTTATPTTPPLPTTHTHQPLSPRLWKCRQTEGKLKRATTQNHIASAGDADGNADGTSELPYQTMAARCKGFNQHVPKHTIQ